MTLILTSTMMKIVVTDIGMELHGEPDDKF